LIFNALEKAILTINGLGRSAEPVVRSFAVQAHISVSPFFISRLPTATSAESDQSEAEKDDSTEAGGKEWNNRHFKTVPYSWKWYLDRELVALNEFANLERSGRW
jgi:hypothetical protein